MRGSRQVCPVGPNDGYSGIRLSGFLLVLWFWGGSWGSAENLLPNADFEGQFRPSGIAEGWRDNSSWADLEVEYGRETDNPHSGQACQRITCTRLDSGAVQMISAQGLPLHRGRIYRVRAWFRGNVDGVVVLLRQAPAPYRVYAQKSLLVTSQWQQLEYFWTSTINDPQSRFMLRFTAVGTLWVDDLAVEEIPLEEAKRSFSPPEQGNLLQNGSFDLGLANWLLNHGTDNWQETTLSIEATGDGPCLKMVVPEGTRARLSSDVVALRPGQPVKITCRVRSAKPTTLTVASNFLRASVKVGETWQTLEATGNVGFQPVNSDFVRFQVNGPTILWLDNVQFRQDGASYGGDPPRAAILPDRHPLALYHEGEQLLLRLLSASSAEVEIPEYTWQIEDFWRNIVLSGRWKPPSGCQEQTIEGSFLPRGWYRATIFWTHQGRDYRNESTFCLLPPLDRQGDLAISPFGAHFALDPTGLKLARAVGVRWLRLHPPNSTKWPVVEPQPGEWRWQDSLIRTAREAGFALCGSLDRCPTWISSAPPGIGEASFYHGPRAWLPRDWAAWENYVAQTVRRYRQDIHVWEVWNEPNESSWLIPPPTQSRAQAYVEILRHTYPVVKREDPTALVIGGCIAGALRESSPSWQFAQQIIDLGALDFMDVFSFHDYIRTPIDEGHDPLERWIARLRGKMRDAGKEIPILNSEGGFSEPGTSLTYRPCESTAVPPDRMAPLLVRQYVTQLAAGIRQFYFYNFFLDGSPIPRPWNGFVEGDGQPRPTVAAYATMTWLLDNAAYERTDHSNSDLWWHCFTTPTGPLIVAWARTGKTVPYRFPHAIKIWDLMGNPQEVFPYQIFPITEIPIYIKP